jgi:hypothetical protein
MVFKFWVLVWNKISFCFGLKEKYQYNLIATILKDNPTTSKFYYLFSIQKNIGKTIPKYKIHGCAWFRIGIIIPTITCFHISFHLDFIL